MHDSPISEPLLKILISQSPVLLVCVVGLIVATRFRHKAAAASRWAMAAFVLALLICGQVAFGVLGGSPFIIITLVPLLLAVTYLLLLIAIYVGRTPREQEPDGMPAEPLWEPLLKTIRRRPGVKNIFVSTFAIVFLVFGLCSILNTLLTPESFRGIARIRLWSNNATAVGTNVTQATALVADPRVIKTECQTIQSEVILQTVVENLDLNRAWGKKYASGELLTTRECIQLLKGRIDVFARIETGIIDIRFYSQSPAEAAKGANALATAYQDHRTRQRDKLKSLQVVQVEILDFASPPYRPIRPNPPLDITFGLWEGLWLGIACGLGAVWIAIKMESRRETDPPPAGPKQFRIEVGF